MDSIPIVEIHRLRDELGIAVEREKWKTAKNRAKAILKLLPLAISKDSKISQAGALHLDGVCNIGWQRIMHAPKQTRDVIKKMNNAIHEAKIKLPKKKKKKK